MKTFRVEFNAAGHVTSCIELDRGAPDSVTIVYVQATSADAAKAKAERVRQRLRTQARRQEYRAQGLCPYCGRTPQSGMVKCETCLVSARERKESRQRPTRSAQHLAIRASKEQRERLATLLEVKRQWRRTDSDDAFINWLDAEIAKLLERKAA